jgi:TM2 domain-containing membrane protein YozV
LRGRGGGGNTKKRIKSYTGTLIYVISISIDKQIFVVIYNFYINNLKFNLYYVAMKIHYEG